MGWVTILLVASGTWLTLTALNFFSPHLADIVAGIALGYCIGVLVATPTRAAEQETR